jgi:CheY-like chemotaxis protein
VPVADAAVPSAWQRRRALVCMGSAYGGDAARALAQVGCKVFAATDTAQAVERMREDGVDVVVLDPEFDMSKQGAGFISRELGAMRMPDRRRVVFVLLSGAARTGDPHEAFLAGANLVVKITEAAELPGVLEKNIRDLNDLYRDFNKALGMAEL